MFTWQVCLRCPRPIHLFGKKTVNMKTLFFFWSMINRYSQWCPLLSESLTWVIESPKRITWGQTMCFILDIIDLLCRHKFSCRVRIWSLYHRIYVRWTTLTFKTELCPLLDGGGTVGNKTITMWHLRSWNFVLHEFERSNLWSGNNVSLHKNQSLSVALTKIRQDKLLAIDNIQEWIFK